MQDIEYNVVNRVAWIRLNRPAQKNAFTLEMIDAWKEHLETAAADDAVGAIVVTGNGDSFCAGADLSIIGELNTQGSAHAWKMLLWERVHGIAFTLEKIDKPVIAAMKGVAVGAGLDMALMCDMRFAGCSASLSEGYIRIGAVPGDGGCFFLPRLVGIAKALELLLSGEFVDADEALRIGMVNRVYDDAQLELKTQEFAEKIASHSPIAVRTIKRATYQSLRIDMRTSLDMMSSHMGMVQTTQDAAEALAAFRERRPARFTGQ
jgi:enoyl-CoA hydratase/carnithine racemase